MEKGLLRNQPGGAIERRKTCARRAKCGSNWFLDSGRARLSVKDDGQGFQPELSSGSFGLTSMQDRTKALGGMWTIHSEPGRGTEVHASIPIPRVAG